MNGAQALIRTLVGCGVDTCFTNPGTSEMHFVAALDTVPEMRSALGLFEGVVTGAADGYGRMADKPAATLLHLGPGLGNGLANLHNARRARTPLVNVVGDHATYHEQYDAPLQSDIASAASSVSGWMRASQRTADVARDAVDAVAKVLVSGEPSALLIGGSVTREAGLVAASQVANATGAKLLGETFPARLQRGAGVPPIERLGYLAEFMTAQLTGLRHLVLVDTKAPVSFFAYPEKPSYLVPDGCDVHVLAAGADDAVGALEHLADVVGQAEPTLQPAARPERPTGDLTGEAVANAIGALLPEGAIVSDEANTAGLWVAAATAGAPPHDSLTLTGGAIGQGLPVATGAAVACPDRKVVCLEADGSAMYTLQALWTQAREDLDVTTVIFNNRSYAILNLELSRVGAESPGPKALDMLDLSRPDLDFAALAEGMGVPAAQATTADELVTALERGLAEPGPYLVDAVLPPRRRPFEVVLGEAERP